VEDAGTILAVDHGTSAVKTALVTATGRVLDTERQPTPIRYLEGGGAEQDPDDWWNAFLKTAAAVLGRSRARHGQVAAVCVSSTFSSTVAVDENGKHLIPALTWMDSRGGAHVARAMAGFPSVLGYGLGKLLRWVHRTGGAPTLSGKDDIGHMLYVKHELPEVYEKTRMFLPSKDYFNARLTGRLVSSHDAMTLFWVTDTRDIRNVRYDDRLIGLLGIDRAKLPPMIRATDVVGTLKPAVADALGLPRETRVVCGSPDHQAACVGSGAVEDFRGHLYIGTSSWIQCVVPFKKTDPLHSIASLPTALPGKYYCANEQDMAGGCVHHAMENVLGLRPGADGYEAFNRLAGEAPAGSGGLLFCPWLNGERTPVDDHHLGGGFYNLRKTTGRAHLARAVLEGVALNTRWSLKYVERFIGRKMDPIHMVGGGARSDLWCRIHADVLGRTIRRVRDPMEANARGAAFIASVGLGWLDFGDIPKHVEIDAEFEPDPGNRELYDRLFGLFTGIYSSNRKMFHRLNR